MSKSETTGSKRILGYTDRLTVRPGERINFKISSKGGESYDAQLVRLVNGDKYSAFASYREIEVPSEINKTYRGTEQSINPGSCVVVEGLRDADLSEMTVAVNLMATVPHRGLQHVLSRWDSTANIGWSLHIDGAGRLAFSTTDMRGTSCSVAITEPLSPGVWYAAALRLSWRRAIAILDCRLLGAPPLSLKQFHECGTLNNIGEYPRTRCPLVIAAAFGGRAHKDRLIPSHCFNGRLESPVIYSRFLSNRDLDEVVLGKRPAKLQNDLLADWNFSDDIGSMRVTDRSANGNHGVALNLPLRGIRGSRWTGKTMEWKWSQSEYSAMHFHDDDLYDCGWTTQIRYDLPANVRSGVYALRLRRHAEKQLELDEEYLPFFVAPPKGTTQASVALILPTYTYLAYGNFRGIEPARRSKGKSLDDFYSATIMGPGTREYACLVDQHSSIGSSLYDRHSDGSPVHFSSWLRPLLNVRPKTVLWTFCADLLLVDWLEAKGLAYDVLTDDLVQQEGIEVLKKYRVCVTGNHPEYQTGQQLDALESYVAQGGRLMYLGGNGCYWRVGVSKSLPGVIEVRRGRTGTGIWQSDVGESCLALSGEVGGIWRELDRPPQRLLGVGFIAQGLGASYYRVTPEARGSSAAFAFEGVDGDVIGDFGIFDGAAGQEIDRTSARHGTPADTVVLARSENHGPGMLYVIEEMDSAHPVMEGYKGRVAAELAMVTNPNGGAVFSVGSMAWCGSLKINDYDNNVSRITENVMRKFLDSSWNQPELNDEMVEVYSISSGAR